MRFLFGLLMGAGLTLLIATAIDAPTNPIVNKLTNVWHTLIDATGEALFRDRATPRPLEVAGAALSAMARPTDDPQPSAPTPLLRERKADGIAGAPVPSNPSAPAPARDPASTAAETAAVGAGARQAAEPQAQVQPEPSAQDTALPAPAAEISPRPDSLDAQLTAPGGPGAADANGSAPQAPASEGLTLAEQVGDPVTLAAVWEPFHSERSARGFANRLEEHVAHAFAVERQGPGAYQVVFSYSSESERDLVLNSIAEITGR